MKRLISTILLLAAMIPIFAQPDSGNTLYSQMDAYETYYYAYSFEYSYMPDYNTYGADDFVVPAGETWDVFSIKTIMKGYGNPLDVNVSIYLDDNGSPGTEIHTYTDITNYIVTDVTGWDMKEIETMLPAVVSLTEGTYWISVYCDGDFWQWQMQSSTPEINSKAHLRNPGGSNFPTHVDWDVVPIDYTGGLYFNLSFSLHEPPLDNDLTITDITSPISGELTVNETIEVVIENVGLLTQTTFDVQYQVNGGASVIETATASVGNGESFIYAFTQTADLSVLGDHTITATVLLSNDQNTANDTYSEVVTNYGVIHELTSTSTSVTECSALFTDAGGVVNGFTANDGGTLTIYPMVTGDRSALDFTFFDFGMNDHHFVIYDGETNSGNILYTYRETWHAYGEHNDPPGFIRARNESGALTVELIPYQYMTEDPGWIADISCVTPEDVDFTALDIKANAIFYHQNMPVEVVTHITNSGALPQSREVSLYEDNALVSTVTSAVLNPGDIEEIVFTWLPQNIGSSVELKVEVENDPGATNADNSAQIDLQVFSQFALVESFESNLFPPEYWNIKVGGYELGDYGAYHMDYLLKTNYSVQYDTLVTPLLMIGTSDSLSFFMKGYGKTVEVLYSSSANGPWIQLSDVSSQLAYSWTRVASDLSSLAGGDYYLAIATGSSGSFSLDYVMGPDIKFQDNDLKLNVYEPSIFPAVAREADYHIEVKNIGLNDILGSDYTVNLMDAVSSEVLASMQGVDIGSFYTQSFEFYYIFAATGDRELYAEVIYASDDAPENNISETATIYVQTEGTYDFICPGEISAYPYNLYPIANSYNYGLSEMIYYPEEIAGTGNITGITLTYYADVLVPLVPVKIYMGTTQDSIMNDWITADQLNLVFDGYLDFNSFDLTEMYIPLDVAFEYDGSENLLIMMDKNNSVFSGNVWFSTINTQINYRGYNIYDNAADIDPFAPNPNLYLQRYDDVPAMRFLVNTDDAPVFTSSPVTLVGENEDYFYEAIISYTGSNTLAIEEGFELPVWLTLTDNGDQTAILEGTTSELGDHSVQLLATDGVYNTTQTFDILVAAVPVFVSYPTTMVGQGQEYNYLVTVTYNGAGFATITEGVDFPAWLTLTDNGNNTAWVTGTTDQMGEYDVEIVASGDYLSATQEYTVIVASMPEFISTPVTLVGENLDYSYEAEVTYTGAGYVTFEEGSTFPDWLTLTDNGDNTATLTGTTDILGDHDVEIKAMGDLIYAIQEYTINVEAVPVFTSTPMTTINLNSPYNYDVTVTYNGVGPVAIVEGVNMPAWLTLTDNGDNTATLYGTPTVANAYDVDIIAEGEFFNTTQSFVLDVMVGIGESEIDELRIYPNPANSYVNFENMKDSEVRIHSITGQLMRSIHVNTDHEMINVQDLENGAYFIHIIRNNTSTTKKLIIF